MPPSSSRPIRRRRRPRRVRHSPLCCRRWSSTRVTTRHRRRHHRRRSPPREPRRRWPDDVDDHGWGEGSTTLPATDSGGNEALVPPAVFATVDITVASVTCDGEIHVEYATAVDPEPSPVADHVVVFHPVSDPAAIEVAHIAGNAPNGVRPRPTRVRRRDLSVDRGRPVRSCESRRSVGDGSGEDSCDRWVLSHCTSPRRLKPRRHHLPRTTRRSPWRFHCFSFDPGRTYPWPTRIVARSLRAQRGPVSPAEAGRHQGLRLLLRPLGRRVPRRRRELFARFHKNHVAKNVGTLEELIDVLAGEVDRGVTHIREIVLLAHGNSIGLLFPVVNGVPDTNLREYKYLTAFSLACLQKDIEEATSRRSRPSRQGARQAGRRLVGDHPGLQLRRLARGDVRHVRLLRRKSERVLPDPLPVLRHPPIAPGMRHETHRRSTSISSASTSSPKTSTRSSARTPTSPTSSTRANSRRRSRSPGCGWQIQRPIRSPPTSRSSTN